MSERVYDSGLTLSHCKEICDTTNPHKWGHKVIDTLFQAAWPEQYELAKELDMQYAKGLAEMRKELGNEWLADLRKIKDSNAI